MPIWVRIANRVAENQELMIVRVLLVASLGLRKRFKNLLACPQALVEEVSEEEFRALLANNFDTVIADLVVVERDCLPPDLESLHAAISRPAMHSELVAISSREDATDRAMLLAAGCMGVLYTGLPDELLQNILSTLMFRIEKSDIERRQHIQSEAQLNEAETFSGGVTTILSAHQTPPPWKPLSELTSVSPSMQTFLEVTSRLTKAETTVLMLGETGVGKETIARGIHLDSRRTRMPFVAVNCAGLHEGLLESQLFGHERGAFTGADRARKGAFELAHRGTLLLDEIGDMPLGLQAKLLRVLQERTIQSVGGEKEIPIDVRIMAATNSDLQKLIAEKRFREDLYYRLAVVSLTVPPLRQRCEDIPHLAQGYLKLFSLRMGRVVEGLSYDALQAMLQYSWPGNVRELVNAIERAVLLSKEPMIGAADLGLLQSTQSMPIPAGDADVGVAASLRRWAGDKPLHEARQEAVASFERDYLDRLLRETSGQVGLAARRAGLSQRSLFNKMRQYDLYKETYRR